MSYRIANPTSQAKLMPSFEGGVPGPAGRSWILLALLAGGAWLLLRRKGGRRRR